MPKISNKQRLQWTLQIEIWRAYVLEASEADPEAQAEEIRKISSQVGAKEIVIPLAGAPLVGVESEQEIFPLSAVLHTGSIIFDYDSRTIASASSSTADWLAPLLQDAKDLIDFFAVECEEEYVVVASGVPGAICMTAIEEKAPTGDFTSGVAKNKASQSPRESSNSRSIERTENSVNSSIIRKRRSVSLREEPGFSA